MIWFLLLQGMALWAGLRAARWFIPSGDPLSYLVAAAVLSWTWVTLGLQTLGFLGFLERAPLLGWCMVGGLLSLGLTAFSARPGSTAWRDDLSPEPRPQPLLMILISALLLWLGLTLTARSLMSPVKVVSDGPIYHLYFANRWWEEGRIHWIASPFGESAATYFPANGELWFTWLITSWGGDRLARIGQLPFLVLSCITLYGLIRRLGCSIAASYLAVAWFATLLPLALFSLEPNVDTIFLAGYLVSVYFAYLYLNEEANPRLLILSGLGAGLALGTKPTALVFIPPWLLLLSYLVLRTRSSSPRWTSLLALWAACVLPSGVWMIRNLAVTGNPWYPLHLELFGRVLLQGWYPRSAMWKSPFFISVRNWRALVDNLILVLDARLTLIWVAAALGLWGMGLSKATPIKRRWIVGFCLLGLLNVALYWLVIPYRTQQRFMLHGIALLTVPLAALFYRWTSLRWICLGLLAIHLLTNMNWPFAAADQISPWSLEKLIAPVGDSMIRIPLNAQDWVSVIQPPRDLLEGMHQSYFRMRLGLGFISLVVAALWVFSKRSLRARFLLVAGTSGLALAAACGWIGLWLGTLNYQYPEFEYYPAWTFLEGISPSRGSRIAYAGTNLPYYLLGKGTRNQVSYVNIDEHPTWQMHHYQQAALAAGGPKLWDSPRPGWDRMSPDISAWLTNLQNQRVEFLFVAQANPAEGEFNCVDPENFPIERVWADQHPDRFKLIYGGNLTDPRTHSRTDGRVRIYRILP